MSDTITARISTDKQGCLTGNSVLSIEGDGDYLIPTRTDGGGIFAPKRVLETIRAAGYKPATDYYSDLGTYPGGITVALVKA